jgi:hypothetical protein
MATDTSDTGSTALGAALSAIGSLGAFGDMSGAQQTSALLQALAKTADKAGKTELDPKKVVDAANAAKAADKSLKSIGVSPQTREKVATDIILASTGSDVTGASDASSGGGMSIGPGILAAAGLVDDVVVGAAPASLAPIVAYDAAEGSDSSRRAYAKMVIEPSNRIEALQDTYIADFGFDKAEKETIRGPSIRDPYLGITPEDMAAVVAVATAIGTEPAYVLSVWIYEGKYIHNAMLHGGAEIPAGPYTPGELLSLGGTRIRAYLRSLLLYGALGADKMTAYIYSQSVHDNVVLDASAAHDVKFSNSLSQMRQAAVRGVDWASAESKLMAYYRDSGGGLAVRSQSTADGSTAFFAKPRSGSLASWLWLQHALSQAYRAELEGWFATTYGSNIDLSDQPWVTYLYWNGGPGVEPWLKGAADPQAAIDHLFGTDAAKPAKLNSDQLDRYYGRGKYAGAQSVAALANAVLVKYLTEATAPWFA